MELVRKILLEMEQRGSHREQLNCLSIEGYNNEQVSYHIKLLHEAGLMEGIDMSSRSGFQWFAKSLTWDGHEFLDAAREDSRWNKAMKMGKEKGGSLTFELLKEVLVTLARGALGIGSC
jgi:hypothetical protein